MELLLLLTMPITDKRNVVSGKGYILRDASLTIGERRINGGYRIEDEDAIRGKGENLHLIIKIRIFIS